MPAIEIAVAELKSSAKDMLSADGFIPIPANMS